METQISLDAIVLNQMGSYSRSEFQSILSVMHDRSLDRFGVMNPDSIDKAEEVRDIALKFAAVYLAAYEELQANLAFNRKKDRELLNIMAGYVACQAVMQLNRSRNDSAALENKLAARRNPDFSGIDFKSSENLAVDMVLKSYSEFMTAGTTTSNITSETNYFFFNLSNMLLGLASRDKYAKHKELLKGLVVKGPNFRVAGIKQEQQKAGQAEPFMDGEEQFKKDFDTIKLTEGNRVYRKDVVGNEEALVTLDDCVKKVVAYRKVDRANPYLHGRKRKGFSQGILLIGDTGTGKTLCAYYGMTLAEAKAKRYGRDVHIVKFNILSSYQEGGVQMLKHQLNQICSGDGIYYVFLDEIDTLVASRGDSSNNSHYQRQKLGELMRFLDGDYPNPGNYLIVATGNDPRRIDRALKNARLERIYCPGPLTAEQKAKTIALHFGGDISAGKVKVDDWRTIGAYALKLGLNGREILGVVSNCYKAVQGIDESQEDQINSAPTLQAARALVSRYTSSITPKLIISQMIAYRKKDEDEQKAERTFYQDVKRPVKATL
ncbi:ATP-binding protein [Candidatus Woesearchaeota archaeon]|nr:ATP-binding protein [Candidatus Woesearchaeota archaeon]